MKTKINEGHTLATLYLKEFLSKEEFDDSLVFGQIGPDCLSLSFINYEINELFTIEQQANLGGYNAFIEELEKTVKYLKMAFNYLENSQSKSTCLFSKKTFLSSSIKSPNYLHVIDELGTFSFRFLNIENPEQNFEIIASTSNKIQMVTLIEKIINLIELLNKCIEFSKIQKDEILKQIAIS